MFAKAKIGVIGFVFAILALGIIQFFPVLFGSHSDATDSQEESIATELPVGEMVGFNGTISVSPRQYDSTHDIYVSEGDSSFFYVDANGDPIDPTPITVYSLTGTVETPDVGIDKPVTITLNSSFTLHPKHAARVTVTITPLQINLDSIKVEGKTYDGNTDAVVTEAVFSSPILDITTIPKENIPVPNIDFGITARFRSADVNRNGSNVTTRPVDIVGTLDWWPSTRCANFQLINNTTSGLQEKGTTALISPRTISLAGVTVESKVFDGYDNATVSSVSWDNPGSLIAPIPSLSDLMMSARFESADVGTRKVNITNVILNTDGAGRNYSLASPNLQNITGVITPRDVNIQSFIVEDKDYNGKDNAKLLTFGGERAVDFKSEDLVGVHPDRLPSKYPINSFMTYKLTFDNINVGVNRSVTMSEVSIINANFRLGTDSIPKGSATIRQRIVSLSTITAKDKVYDGTTDAVLEDVTLNMGLDFSENKSLVPKFNVDFVLDNPRFETANAGINKDVVYDGKPRWMPGSTLSSNIDFDETLAPIGTAKITPRPVRLKSITVQDKFYDGGYSANVIDGTFDTDDLTHAIVSGSEIAPVFTDLSGITAAFAQANVGEGLNVKINGAGFKTDAGSRAANFSLRSDNWDFLIGKARIKKRPTYVLSITAANKVYDGTDRATVLSVEWTAMGAVNGMNPVAESAKLRPEIDFLVAAVFEKANAGNNVAVSVTDVRMHSANFELVGDLPSIKKASAHITPCPFSVTSIMASGRAYNGTNVVAITSAVLSGADYDKLAEANKLVRDVDYQINGILDSPNAGVRTVTINSNSVVKSAGSEKMLNFTFVPAAVPPTIQVTISRGVRTGLEVPELKKVYKKGITLSNFTLPATWQWKEPTGPFDFLPGVHNVPVMVPGDMNYEDYSFELPIKIVHRAPDVTISGSKITWTNMPQNAGYGIYVNGKRVHMTEPNVTSFDLDTLDINTKGKTIQVRTFGVSEDLHSELSAVPPPNRTLLIVLLIIGGCAALGTGGFFGFKYFKKARADVKDRIKWNDVDGDYEQKTKANYVNNFLRGKTMPASSSTIQLPKVAVPPPSGIAPVRTFQAVKPVDASSSGGGGSASGQTPLSAPRPTYPTPASRPTYPAPSAAGTRPTYPTPSSSTGSVSTAQHPPKPSSPPPSVPPRPSYPPPTTPRPTYPAPSARPPSTVQTPPSTPPHPRPTYPTPSTPRTTYPTPSASPTPPARPSSGAWFD